MNERPPVPHADLSPDLRWEAREAPDWTTDPADMVGVSACRRFARYRSGCPNPVAAVLYRPRRRSTPDGRFAGTRPARWGYCVDHMYGRWIEAGKVMEWVVRRA